MYTMLATIKKYIDEMPNTSFNEMYIDYVSQIQDYNLNKEFSSVLLNGINLRADYMQSLISGVFEELRGMV